MTLRLAPLFEAAVGLDPDPEMLAYASRAAADQGAGNVAWVGQRAEALPAGLGSFRAVTFAASFHWMDRPRVASAVATMLDRGGAVVQVDAPGCRTGELASEARRGSLPFPPPPDGALDQLRRQYLGSDRRAGQGIRNTSPSGEDQVFREAGFLPAQAVTVPDQRIIERTTDDVVAGVFSSSSTAPHLFGDRREDFERDMREILAQASPQGRFSFRLPDNILRIWRLPALSGGSGLACPEQRVAAVAFGNELLAGDLQAGLADPGPVGTGVGVTPPHGRGSAEPVVLGACPRILPGDGQEPAGKSSSVASARMKLAAGTSWRARSICTPLMSTPVTWYPALVRCRATGTPHPHPISRIRPAAGRRSCRSASQPSYSCAGSSSPR